MFSDKIISGYWMKFVAINAVTDLKDYLFCFKKKGWKDNIWKQFNPSDPPSLAKTTLAA